jgi:hypothetical protein
MAPEAERGRTRAATAMSASQQAQKVGSILGMMN